MSKKKKSTKLAYSFTPQSAADAAAYTHENCGQEHFVPDNGDHILAANCECKPWLVDGVLVHNALRDTGYSR